MSQQCRQLPVYTNFWWSEKSVLFKTLLQLLWWLVSKFVSSNLICAYIEGEYNDSVMRVSKDDKYYDIKLATLNKIKK